MAQKATIFALKVNSTWDRLAEGDRPAEAGGLSRWRERVRLVQRHSQA